MIDSHGRLSVTELEGKVERGGRGSSARGPQNGDIQSKPKALSVSTSRGNERGRGLWRAVQLLCLVSLIHSIFPHALKGLTRSSA